MTNSLQGGNIMGFLFWGEKNKFKQKFSKIKLKDLQDELFAKQGAQDKLQNQIERVLGQYDEQFAKATKGDASESVQQIAASKMEVFENDKARLQTNLDENINETSIIQAAIDVKREEKKGNKHSFIQIIKDSSGQDLENALSEIATKTKGEKAKLNDALDTMIKPTTDGNPDRSVSFNRNMEKIKKARGEN